VLSLYSVPEVAVRINEITAASPGESEEPSRHIEDL